MRRLLLLISITFSAIVISFGCGSSATPTSPADLPLSIESIDGTSGIPVDSSFEYTFDEAVDTSTVTASTFFIVETASGGCDESNALAASVECSSNTECVLDPESNLQPETGYTICLTENITYLNGISFTSTSFSFTTEDDGISGVVRADGLPSAGLSSTAPADRLSGTVANATMTITFDEAMTASTVNTDNITLTCGGQAQEISIAVADSDNKVFTITPSSQLLQVSECTLAIGTSVADADGNTLPATVNYVFNTKCASSDEFLSDTFSAECWALGSQNDAYPDLTSSDSYYSIDTESGLLNFAAPAGYTINSIANGGNGYCLIVKQSTSDNLTVTVNITSVSNMDSYVSLGGGLGRFDGIALTLQDSSNNTATINWNWVFDDGDNEYRVECASSTGASAKSSDGCPDVSESNKLRIVKEGTSFTLYYYNNNQANFNQLTTFDLSSFVDSYVVALGFYTANGDGTFSGSIDSVTFEAGSADDQD